MSNQVDINGFCSDKFPQFREAFEKNFEEGHEIGASVCLTLEGETIVDLWGGFADGNKSRPWEEDTIACVFSATKIPTITCGTTAVCGGATSRCIKMMRHPSASDFL